MTRLFLIFVFCTRPWLSTEVGRLCLRRELQLNRPHALGFGAAVAAAASRSSQSHLNFSNVWACIGISEYLLYL